MQKANFGFGVIEGGKPPHDGFHTPDPKLVQAGLFPFGQGRSLIFVSIPGVTEQEFVALVQIAQPAFAVELRRAPRFDIGRLTRQTVFERFEDAKCKYLDPAPKGDAGGDDVKNWIGPTLDVFRQNSGRPIMFFVSTSQDTDLLRRNICNALGCWDGEWQIFEVPNSQASLQKSAPEK